MLVRGGSTNLCTLALLTQPPNDRPLQLPNPVIFFRNWLLVHTSFLRAIAYGGRFASSRSAQCNHAIA
ncbi:hypothetical protein SD81_007340 [Tolypothrix campylonemoides VB511288]|nr:hypothetical protein SD81_007340 [Tolypothrix campylonemoides VB511288]